MIKNLPESILEQVLLKHETRLEANVPEREAFRLFYEDLEEALDEHGIPDEQLTRKVFGL